MACLSQKKNKIIWISGIFLMAGMSVGVASRLSAQGATKVDRIVIEKSKRTLTLMSGSKSLKKYKVALGGQPLGAKDRQGDHKTPEGIYSVDARNPNSQFYKAPHISYPNPVDRANARKLGVALAAMLKFTDWARNGDGLARSTASRTGQTVASR